MSKEFILMLHPTFGVLAMLAAVWFFVEVLNVSQVNRARIKTASLAVAALIWLSYIVGGYWYVNYYAADKAIILKGPWPLAHGLVMETKEHLFFVLLLVSTYLPIAASGTIVSGNQIVIDRSARNLLLTLATLVVLLSLAME